LAADFVGSGGLDACGLLMRGSTFFGLTAAVFFFTAMIER
jgi:hypothetical protein